MDDSSKPTLLFNCDFDERTAWEVEQKGWFEGAVAVMPNGVQIPVSFWDPTRLSQELNDRVKSGRVCFAEPGLIIVPSVTLGYMQRAINELAGTGYFDRLLALMRK